MWQVAIVNRLDQGRVGVNSLLFKVAYESVAERRRQQVSEKVRVKEKTLCRNDGESL